MLFGVAYFKGYKIGEIAFVLLKLMQAGGIR